MAKYIPYLSFAFFFFGCSDDLQKIIVLNESYLDVSEKLVSISKGQLNSSKDMMLPVIENLNGERLPSQLIDDDNDGRWDQLIFQVSIASEEEQEFTIKWVSKRDYPVFEKLTQVYLGYSELRDGKFTSLNKRVRDESHSPQHTPYTYQFEGPGWESNLVAFRSYFDTRNGKDIFGKITEQMVTDQIGTGENYHELQDWGMDILKVGQSLGAGALAILRGDSLIRLGKTKLASFEKTAEGPVYSSFKLIYKGWDVLGKEYELNENISIQANKRWFKSEVSIRSEEAEKMDTLVTGIVNLKEAQVEGLSHRGYQTLYTHGQQSENRDVLGMALIVADNNFIQTSKAPTSGEGITNSELVYFRPTSGNYQYHFYVGWELENSDFLDRERFEKALYKTMEELSVDLKITIR